MNAEMERKIEIIEKNAPFLAWKARLRKGWVTNGEFEQAVERIYRRRLKGLGIDPNDPPLTFNLPEEFGHPNSGILVGNPVHEQAQMPPLYLPIEDLTCRHVGVWGQTRYGKTFLMASLISQVAGREPQRTFICYDTQGELPGILANLLPADKLLWIPVQDYWKNPFQDVKEHGLDKAIGIHKRALMEAVFIGDATANLKEQLVRRHCTAENLSASGPPTLEEVLQSARSLDLSAGKGIGVSRKLLEYQQSLVNILGNLSLHLDCIYNRPISRGFLFTDFDGKVVVIDISSIKDPIAIKFLVVKELLESTLHVEKPHLPLTVVLDELHRFAPLEKKYGFTEPALVDCVKTMLKSKVNFWYAEQNPGMMVHPAIFANTGTHFAFRMPSIRDRLPVLYAINISSKEQEQAVGELEKQHCLVYSDSLGKAVLIRTPDLDIRDLREEAHSWSSPVVKAFHERFLAESPAGRKTCHEKSDVASTGRRTTESPPVQDLTKKRIAEHRARFPLSGITETYSEMGISSETGKKHLKEMLDLGWLEGPIRVPAPGKGNKSKHCYVVTEEGCRALGLNWQEARLPGKGSLKSKLAAKMMGLYLESHGSIVRFEHTLTKGAINKAADVAVLEKDGSITAYEYQNTTGHLIENLSKNAEVGFSRTAVVSPTNALIESAKRLVEKQLAQDLRNSVTFVTLKEFAQ
jgi:hypothetical protein